MLGIERLQEAYFARVPDYPRGITVPAIVDVPTGAGGHQRLRADDARPVDASGRPTTATARPSSTPSTCATRSTRWPSWCSPTSTTASTGAASPAARTPTSRPTRQLFARLDWLTDRLADQRYLVGDTITEADVRLFTTLARFDAVYHGHFKCNRQKLTEMPVLWAYARDLFQTPGFGDTTDFVQIKQHYYGVHTNHQPDRDRPGRARTCRAG